MSEEIYINNGTSFQQPYIARNTVNSQTPVIGQQPSQQPTVGRTPFTYQERAPSTYRNPVNYRIPYIANKTGTTPVIANSQSPYIANAQQPARAAVGYRVPFTYQNRQPATYRHTGRTPFTYQSRQPSTYQAQGRSPYPYIANARASATYPANAQQPYPYIANAQQPYPYIASAQQPAIAIGRTPFTYQHQQPVIGRVPYIYAQETDYVDDVFVDSGSNMDYPQPTVTSHFTPVISWTGPAKQGMQITSLNGSGGGNADGTGVYNSSEDYDATILKLGSSTVYNYDGNGGSPNISGSWPTDNVFWKVQHPSGSSGLNYTSKFALSSQSGENPTFASLGYATAGATWSGTAQTFGHNSATGRLGIDIYHTSDYTSNFVSIFTFTATQELSGYTTYTWVCTVELQAESEEDDCPECCIVDNEMITTPEGDKHINELSKGDFVIGYNWKTDRIEKTPITHIRRVFRGGIIKVNDLKMTDDHPIYLADGRLASYNPAGTEANYRKVCAQLKEGDEILDINGNKVTVNSIQRISGKEKVYTIMTGLENFYASGILVDSAVAVARQGTIIHESGMELGNVNNIRYFI